MCGIAGIVGRLSEPNRSALKRMSRALAHRGPDGEGFWESPADPGGNGLMLAHRRLSILDLSPAGAQPMVDPATGAVVAMNGEIYNYVSLREELQAAGQTFRSTGDTAVMLRLLGLHGHDAVKRLRGMFAFALWDPEQRALLLARDPLGIKPLYLARNPKPDAEWTVAFASEIRAILASGLVAGPTLNPAAAAMAAWNGFMVTPETAVAGIESIWPGELLVFDREGIPKLATQYWTPAAAEGDAEEVGESALERALKESAQLHLASDVPLGVFLSGGIDSSAVANLAAKASQQEVHTFTLGFDEPAFDERPVARRVAQAIGTKHREIVLTERRFVGELDAALGSLDQPTFDGLNAYYMSHAVREAGFKVALVGTGGDELFGGYTSFRDLPRLRGLLRLARWVPRPALAGMARAALAILQPSRAGMRRQTRWAKLPDMIFRGDDLLSQYQMAYALFLPEFQNELLESPLGRIQDGLPVAMRDRLRRESKGRTPLSAISILEHRLFLGERLLRDTDAASMSASIEVRLPLVDQVVLENADRVTDANRFHPLGRKAMLRTIGLQGMDPLLFDRPKRGFELPYDRWIRKGLGAQVGRMLRDPQAVRAVGLNPVAVARLWQAFQDGAPGLYWSRVWAIYVLIEWCHRHRVYL